MVAARRHPPRRRGAARIYTLRGHEHAHPDPDPAAGSREPPTVPVEEDMTGRPRNTGGNLQGDNTGGN